MSEYIQQTKMDEAKMLLTYSNTPISEICALLNYSDQSYFTKVFKKQTGTTPKQFRDFTLKPNRKIENMMYQIKPKSHS